MEIIQEYINKIYLYGDHAEIGIKDNNGNEITRALIDLDDVDRVKNINWYLCNGKVIGKIKYNKSMFLHKFIFDKNSTRKIYFRNDNYLDCRKENLYNKDYINYGPCKHCGQVGPLIKGYCNKHHQQLIRHGKFLNKTKESNVSYFNEIERFENHAEMSLYNLRREEIARAIIDLDDVHRVSQLKWHVRRSKGVITNVESSINEFDGSVTRVSLNKYIMTNNINNKNKITIKFLNNNKLDFRKSNLICK